MLGLLPSFPTTPNSVNSCLSALGMPFIFQSVSSVSSELNSYNGRVPGNTFKNEAYIQACLAFIFRSQGKKAICRQRFKNEMYGSLT